MTTIKRAWITWMTKVSIMMVLMSFGWNSSARYTQPATLSTLSNAYVSPLKWNKKSGTIQKYSPMGKVLFQLGLKNFEIRKLVKTAQKHMNLKNIQPGTEIKTYSRFAPSSRPSDVEIQITDSRWLHLSQSNGTWTAKEFILPIKIKIAKYSGVVKNSLWASARKAGVRRHLIGSFSAIFAWQMDFSREVKTGDRWRFVVEQKFADDKPIGWGRILAAEYITGNKNLHGIHFEDPKGKSLGYFDKKGASLRKMFLKSPIQFGRVTSRFQKRRLHPILKKHRAHLGVDYAAPTGTPILAVGDATVAYTGNTKGSGNTIKLKHNTVYQTAYRHLSKFAPGIKAGAKIKLGQIIGYVGSTGLATGPHLHFEFYQNGEYIDPLGSEFPSTNPVPEKMMDQFKMIASQRWALQPSWEFQQGIESEPKITVAHTTASLSLTSPLLISAKDQNQ